MAKKTKSRSDILLTVEQSQQAASDQLSAARRELIQGVHSGAVDDPHSIETQLSVIGMTVDELRAEVAKLDERADLQKQLAAEPALTAELADLESDFETRRQTYAASLQSWNESRDRISPQLDSLRIRVGAFDTIRDKIRKMLDDSKLSQIAALDDQLAGLTVERQVLLDQLREGVVQTAEGHRYESLRLQIQRKRANIAAIDQQLPRERDAGKLAQMRAERDSAVASISELEDQIDGAQIAVADIEARQNALSVERAEHEIALLAGT